MTARSGGIDSGGIAHNEAETAFFDVVFIDGSVACAADLPSAVERYRQFSSGEHGALAGPLLIAAGLVPDLLALLADELEHPELVQANTTYPLSVALLADDGLGSLVLAQGLLVDVEQVDVCYHLIALPTGFSAAPSARAVLDLIEASIPTFLGMGWQPDWKAGLDVVREDGAEGVWLNIADSLSRFRALGSSPGDAAELLEAAMVARVPLVITTSSYPRSGTDDGAISEQANREQETTNLTALLNLIGRYHHRLARTIVSESRFRPLAIVVSDLEIAVVAVSRRNPDFLLQSPS